jgi:cytochrome c2
MAKAILAVAVLVTVAALLLAVSALGNMPDQKALMTPQVVGTPPFAEVVGTKVSVASATRGQKLYLKYDCFVCHRLEANGTGPMLRGLGQRAGARRPNYTAEAYLYESITAPNAFVVPDYPAGVMLQNFAATISEADLYDLIAWLRQQ